MLTSALPSGKTLEEWISVSTDVIPASSVFVLVPMVRIDYLTWEETRLKWGCEANFSLRCIEPSRNIDVQYQYSDVEVPYMAYGDVRLDPIP